MKEKTFEQYPANIQSRITKAGGLMAYRAQMKAQRSKVTTYGRGGFGKLKDEGKIDELKAIASRGGASGKAKSE